MSEALALTGETRIRCATPYDIPGMVALGIEALENDPYPNLVIAPARIERLARDIVTGPAHFAWVADRDGEIVGSVAAIVGPMTHYERNQASVVQFYCKVPGAGIKLLREFLRWARGRRGIKAILFTIDHGADPRIGKLLGRLGLDQTLPVFMETR